MAPNQVPPRRRRDPLEVADAAREEVKRVVEAAELELRMLARRLQHPESSQLHVSAAPVVAQTRRAGTDEDQPRSPSHDSFVFDAVARAESHRPARRVLTIALAATLVGGAAFFAVTSLTTAERAPQAAPAETPDIATSAPATAPERPAPPPSATLQPAPGDTAEPVVAETEKAVQAAPPPADPPAPPAVAPPRNDGSGPPAAAVECAAQPSPGRRVNLMVLSERWLAAYAAGRRAEMWGCEAAGLAIMDARTANRRPTPASPVDRSYFDEELSLSGSQATFTAVMTEETSGGDGRRLFTTAVSLSWLQTGDSWRLTGAKLSPALSDTP